MEDVTLIHERRDRKMQPFYWILSFECFTLLAIFGLALAGLSGFGAVQYGGWTLLLLLLVPVGLWLAWTGCRLLSKFIWENTHLSTYRLYRDRVEMERYDKGSRTRSEEVIRFSGVVQASIGHHVAMYHYAYMETKWRERQQLAHILPSLLLVHQSADGLRAAEIPFYDLRDMQPWLERLQALDVPLHVYTRMFNTTDEAGRAMLLTESEDTMSYTYEEALKLRHDRLLQQIQTFSDKGVQA
ncbi:hypothetical protein [Paenibacillus sp. 1P07SE]|uniref:hypothetical protein n=1 Tax=Paenibacillus sp. 1P07SE TaxID=3132209 RepID=UPI0039A6C00D